MRRFLPVLIFGAFYALCVWSSAVARTLPQPHAETLPAKLRRMAINNEMIAFLFPEGADYFHGRAEGLLIAAQVVEEDTP